jgi:uncharacterized membrane protein YdjX (TVP38/TMEM64 family)
LNSPFKLLLVIWMVAIAFVAATYFNLGELLRGSLIWAEGLGAWKPIAFIAIYNVATVLFIPGIVLTMSGGVLFGVGWGSVYVAIAAILGATWAFAIGRYLFRDLFDRLIQGHPKFEAIDKAVAADGFKVVLLTRLSPVLPFNLLNYAFGLTQVSLKDYILGSLGIIPGTVMYVYLGASIGDLAMLGRSDLVTSPATSGIQWTIRGVGFVATVAMTVYLSRLAQKALNTII